MYGIIKVVCSETCNQINKYKISKTNSKENYEIISNNSLKASEQEHL